jgi:hypothetical protein
MVAELYRTGYVGGAVPEAIDWMVAHSEGAQNICVPFAGIGRSIIAMSRPDTIIESWDTMLYTECIMQGVFNADEIATNVDGLRYRKGWCYENRPFKNMDDRSAGFVDWVAQEGTLYDKACIGSAMVRCTLMARMMQWHANVEQLFTRFQKQFEYNKDWLHQPGKRIHHHGNFFDADLREAKYDLIEVDPPKVINYSDIYSLHFSGFNNALMQNKITLPKWSRRNSLRQFREVLKTPAPKIIFMYVSKVLPPLEDVRRVLAEAGEITEEADFFHNGRYDYGFVIEREVKEET